MDSSNHPTLWTREWGRGQIMADIGAAPRCLACSKIGAEASIREEEASSAVLKPIETFLGSVCLLVTYRPLASRACAAALAAYLRTPL